VVARARVEAHKDEVERARHQRAPHQQVRYRRHHRRVEVATRTLLSVEEEEACNSSPRPRDSPLIPMVLPLPRSSKLAET
jgi:hypothetical protein